MEPLPVGELSALLGEGCFLHIARGDDALFVTDAPLRFSRERRQNAARALMERGFVVDNTPAGLWKIDCSGERFFRIFDAFSTEPAAAFPVDERAADVYALERLLDAHPSPWKEQPTELLRAIAKNCGRREELIRRTPKILQNCAMRIRRGMPLPSAAAGMLRSWLRTNAIEGDKQL
jgi:hypothetical protein